MKFLALNLPAFHQIPENDNWWGEGFTEWDNVKGGKPLFKEHYQPIKPLDDDYYDLSSKEDILKQIKIAKKYDLYGFIYYHYWFGNGKKLFEKPVEILRDEIVEPFHYCFCWANDTWITTWHGLEPKTLIEQQYPGEKDWKEHYDYFVSFFKDYRYIKIHNKPVVFIYQPNRIIRYEEMLNYWNERAKIDGFDGVYCIEFISSKNRSLYSNISNAVTEFEPLYTTFFDVSKLNLFKRFLCKKFNKLDFQDYNYLWNLNINRTRTYGGKPIFRGCFVGWDNSARKGRKSMIVKNNSPKNLGTNLERMLEKNRDDAIEDCIVINAWNEWSEGAFLEPSDRDGFGYLEEIKRLANKY